MSPDLHVLAKITRALVTHSSSWNVGEAVLFRALHPMAQPLSLHMETASSPREDTHGPDTSISHEHNRATLAINLSAMFTLTTGYLLAQQTFAFLAKGELQDPDNIARQKQLLDKVIRAMLIS